MAFCAPLRFFAYLAVEFLTAKTQGSAKDAGGQGVHKNFDTPTDCNLPNAPLYSERLCCTIPPVVGFVVLVMRFVFIGSFHLCLIGGLFCCLPAVAGQAARDLRGVSVLEAETEEERENRELQTRRQRVEQIVDPEQRQLEMNLLLRDEANRQNHLERRRRDEVGANLFYFPRLREPLLREGWCQLFDGHTSFGWRVQTEGTYGGGRFTFGQGEIVSDPERPGWVRTEVPFGDVHLQFDYWAEKDSEVFLLLNAPPDPVDLNTSCYTFVLHSSHTNRPRGLLLGQHRHGLSLAELRTMRDTLDDPLSTEEGTWHSVLVKIDGNNLQFWMDRRPAVTYFEQNPIPSGHIGFLVTKGQARFQNILWRPSQPIPIFDTASILGEIPWQRSEGGEFAGRDDTGFRLFSGTVETKKLYTNYMLQMQYRQGNNSGQSSLWVRAQPGQENTGYEISLQNIPRRVDRERAVGADAGGLLHIKDARYLRVQDQQWNYLTVVAMDRQIQTWVNGVPVCEIFDRRTDRGNTLKDRQRDPFLEPGTIRFTVPPGNSEFQFRRLMVLPVP